MNKNKINSNNWRFYLQKTLDSYHNLQNMKKLGYSIDEPLNDVFKKYKEIYNVAINYISDPEIAQLERLIPEISHEELIESTTSNDYIKNDTNKKEDYER